MNTLPRPTATAARSSLPTAQIPHYYTQKTAAILHKYGPGPRVHFHVGLFPVGTFPDSAVPQRVLKDRILISQEAALSYSAKTWDVYAAPPASLLDIGCGLGGGAIYWAQEHGASVTAITVAAAHIPLIEEFTHRAGVSNQVTPLHVDIHGYVPDRLYDAAYANESSGYMDRGRLFKTVAKSLKPGGWFGIQEHFICRPEWAEFIDGYYKTRLGALGEYISAAEAAGFSLERDEDVTDRVAEFWMQSLAWTTAELDTMEQTRRASPIPRERLQESALTHGKLFRIWRDHALETRLLLFRLKAHP
ncbi:methyltransferase domain-containing protein [Streptomyces sp. 21So2-11]|uniref:SAM-dependent methyltransferase n=1 Tax=Streptomyces sp. 21So2-11 TaxID=3144408 RepID=UPI0032194809